MNLTLITACVLYALETVHLQLEETMQDIQDATSDYLVKIPTPNPNLLYNYNETINYISEFFKAHNYYPGPPTNPTSPLYYTAAP